MVNDVVDAIHRGIEVDRRDARDGDRDLRRARVAPLVYDLLDDALRREQAAPAGGEPVVGGTPVEKDEALTALETDVEGEPGEAFEHQEFLGLAMEMKDSAETLAGYIEDEEGLGSPEAVAARIAAEDMADALRRLIGAATDPGNPTGGLGDDRDRCRAEGPNGGECEKEYTHDGPHRTHAEGPGGSTQRIEWARPEAFEPGAPEEQEPPRDIVFGDAILEAAGDDPAEYEDSTVRRIGAATKRALGRAGQGNDDNPLPDHPAQDDGDDGLSVDIDQDLLDSIRYWTAPLVGTGSLCIDGEPIGEVKDFSFGLDSRVEDVDVDKMVEELEDAEGDETNCPACDECRFLDPTSEVYPLGLDVDVDADEMVDGLEEATDEDVREAIERAERANQ